MPTWVNRILVGDSLHYQNQCGRWFFFRIKWKLFNMSINLNGALLCYGTHNFVLVWLNARPKKSSVKANSENRSVGNKTMFFFSAADCIYMYIPPTNNSFYADNEKISHNSRYVLCAEFHYVQCMYCHNIQCLIYSIILVITALRKSTIYFQKTI